VDTPPDVRFYRLNDRTLMTISRDGQLLIRNRPQENPIHRWSTAESSYKDTRISFINEPSGQATPVGSTRVPLALSFANEPAAK